MIDSILLQILHLEPYTCVSKDLGSRLIGNSDYIETNLDGSFRIPNSILSKFSISVLNCYLFILMFIFHEDS